MPFVFVQYQCQHVRECVSVCVGMCMCVCEREKERDRQREAQCAIFLCKQRISFLVAGGLSHTESLFYIHNHDLGEPRTRDFNFINRTIGYYYSALFHNPE